MAQPYPRPLSPEERPGHMAPLSWIKQRVKPPRLPELTRVNGEGPGSLLCGYLKKDAGHLNQLKAKLHWQSRWFVLDVDQGMLYYYRAGVKPEDFQRVHTRGWVDLRRPGTMLVTDPVALEEEHRGRVLTHQFHLRFHAEDGSLKVLKLAAPSASSYDAWVQAIREVQEQPPVLSAPPTPTGSSQPPQRRPSSRSTSPAISAASTPSTLIDPRVAIAGYSTLVALLALGGPVMRALVVLGGNAGIWLLTHGMPSSAVSAVPPSSSRAVPEHTPGPSAQRTRGSVALREGNVLSQSRSPSPALSAAPKPQRQLPVDPAVLFAGFNALVFTVLFGGGLTSLLTLAIGNATLWYFLGVTPPKKTYGVSARSVKGRKLPAAAVSDDEDGEAEEEETEEEPGGAELADALLPATSPRPPTPTPNRHHVPSRPKYTGGQTLPLMKGPSATHCWSMADPSHFSVRVGPNYAYNKRKAPSQGTILSPVAADFFTCERKIDHIMQYLRLPEVDFEVAHWFVVNAQICDYAPHNPVWGSGDMNGPGMSLVVFNPISVDTWARIQAATSGALELFRRFLNADQSPNAEATYDRMKLIATLLNTDEVQLSSTCAHLVKTFNSKPVLTRPQHRIIHADFYTELDINVHEFSYIARKGIYGFLPKMKEMVVDMALVLEGQEDSELPEMVLTCFTLHRLDAAKAKPW